ncbi:MAG: PspC domain-containing protein [Thermoleophilia bacterium]|nr:PspC domain-containing protein [Thermoleophilia bacterium]
MNRVTTVNLAGRAYQLEEPAFDTLRSYLDTAERRLAASPDKAEVMHDFEDAIARHCNSYLSAAKDVVTEVEMAAIVSEMGPVEVGDFAVDVADSAARANPGASSDGVDAAAPADATGTVAGDTSLQVPPPRRLFRITKGAPIAGVCAGLAAYFNVDVAIVRVTFALLAVVTSGFAIAAYVIMWIAVPEARTPADMQLATQAPALNAQELLDRVRAHGSDPALARVGQVVRTVSRIVGRMLYVLLGVAIAIVATTGVIGVWSALLDGSLAGFAFDRGEPHWHLAVFIGLVSFVALLVLISLLMWVNAMMTGRSKSQQLFVDASMAVTTIVALVVAGSLVWTSSGDVRHLVRSDDNTRLHFGKYSFCARGDGPCDEAVDGRLAPAEPARPAEPGEPARPADPIQPSTPQ